MPETTARTTDTAALPVVVIGAGPVGLAAAAQISSIPTLMAFREGILVFSQPGALPASSLEEVITAVKNLDMNEVRAEVEKQAAQAESAAEPEAPQN